MGENSYKPLEALTYKKSNDLVSAKYKSSLLENKLLAVALTRIEVNAKDPNAPLRARLYPGELKSLVNDETHIYSRLKNVAKTMTGHTVVLEDGKGNFKAMAIVTNANYEHGVVEIRLNNDLRSHILGLEKRYTTLDLSVMTGFRRDASFRLYEIFKSNIYKSNKDVNDGKVDLEYNVSELRFMIGIANPDDVNIRNARTRMGNNIDWDKLYEMLDKKDKMYACWSEFDRSVIRPAQKELAEKSDIRFEYKGIREGHRIKRVRFSIYPNTPEDTEAIHERKHILEKNKKKEPAKPRQAEIPRDLPKYAPLYQEFEGHNGLTAEDIDCLLQYAKGDEKMVRSAVDAADRESHINNYMGWIVSFIENDGYNPPVETINGSSASAKLVKDMKQSISEQSDDLAATFWNRTKERNSSKFQDFVKMLEDHNLTLELFEDACSGDAECGSRYIAWTKGELDSLL